MAGPLELGFELSAGARSTWWFTGDDDDGEETVGSAIDYFAEPAQSWWVGGQLLVMGVPMLGASVQRPFDDSPEQREIIERAFRCRVFDRYGSREFSNVAAECERHEGLHIFADLFHV